MSPTLSGRSLLILVFGLVPVASVRAQSVLLEIDGKSDAPVGYALAAIGDVDGDGAPDLLTSDGGGNARVYSGATGSIIRSHLGNGGNFLSMSGIGDVNLDGVPDYVIAAPEFPNHRFRGAAAVFSGKDGALLHAFTGDSDGDYFGASVSAAGDVDLDGVPDLVVGAPIDHLAWHTTKPAYVRVFSGRTGAKLLEVRGVSATDGLGIAVAGTGDLDGDGHPDFVAAGITGGVHAYSGKDGRLMFSFLQNGRFIQLASSVDIDGDGTNDIVASFVLSTAQNPNGVSAGVFSGKDGRAIHSYSRSDTLPGLSVAGIPDMNGDGHDDFMIGAPSFPIVPGTADLFSGKTGELLYEFRGENSEILGFSIAALGDLNGDGIVDLCVSSPNFRNGLGKITVYSGNDFFLLATPRTVRDGDLLTLSSREGNPGDPTFSAVVKVTGTTVFDPVFGLATLDSTGARVVSLTVPTGLKGITFCLQSFALQGSSLLASDEECVNVK